MKNEVRDGGITPPQKPLIIAIKEEKTKLSSVINDAAAAGLPWNVILSILDELRNGVSNIAEQEYKATEAQYAQEVNSYEADRKKLEETTNERSHE